MTLIMANVLKILYLLLVLPTLPASQLTKPPLKVLFLLPMGSKSHKTAFMPMAEALAKRGHQITVVSPHKPKVPNKDIEEIFSSLAILDDPQMNTELFAHTETNIFTIFSLFKEEAIQECAIFLRHPSFKTLRSSGKKFDAVVVDAIFQECALAVAPLFGKHIMLFSTCELVSWSYAFVQRPPSFVSNLLDLSTDHMSFWQRIQSMYQSLAMNYLFYYDILPGLEQEISKYEPEASPLAEVFRKFSFVLVNSDPVLHAPVPLMPNIERVGGMHCVEAKPLAGEFEDFVQSSGDEGFIIFSLGSIAQGRYLPEEKRQAIIKALSKLKQKVIWKYEEDLEGLPPNVKITKWLPQQDLLGHPKCRLFITHGGLLSLEESMYHGVPVIGIPIFAEQPGNVGRVKQIGVGEELLIRDLTEEILSEKINKLLTDKSYAEKARTYRNILREEYSIQRPEEKAADWIEYVVRHDGVPHLRSSGQELNFFQLHMLDLLAVVLLFSCAFIVVTRACISILKSY